MKRRNGETEKEGQKGERRKGGRKESEKIELCFRKNIIILFIKNVNDIFKKTML